MKFELLGSKYTAADKTEYVRGQIVIAPRDLTKSFPNKFRRREDLEDASETRIEKINRIKAKKFATREQRIAEIQANKEKEAVSRDIADMANKKKNKAKPAPEESDDDTDAEDNTVPVKYKPTKSPLGLDVTLAHKEAVLAEFLVFQNKRGLYNLASKDDPASPINVKPLTTERDVSRAIKRLTSSEE